MPKKTSPPIANQAYEYLYRKIVACEYFPGQDINEKQLMDAAGFGRTPLREALLALQKEGLVEIFPRRGMRIAPFTQKSVGDLYQARKLIEPTVVAEYKSLYAKASLLDFQRRFEESETMESLVHFQLDVSFHSYLIGITENIILMDMYHSLMVQQVRLAVYASLHDPYNRSDNFAQHTAIINALLRENEHDARDAIILHINHSLVSSQKAVSRALSAIE